MAMSVTKGPEAPVALADLAYSFQLDRFMIRATCALT